MASKRSPQLDLIAIASALVYLPEQIREMRDELKRLNLQTASLQMTARAVYDVKGLVEMGVPRNEAYEIMRKHGSRAGANGRFIITRAALEEALSRTAGTHPSDQGSRGREHTEAVT